LARLLSEGGQVIGIKLWDTPKLNLKNCLKHALSYPKVNYSVKDQMLQVRFIKVREDQVARVVKWDANLDFDSAGQIIGIEILFGGKLALNNRLKYIEQYRVGFDELFEELPAEQIKRLEELLDTVEGDDVI